MSDRQEGEEERARNALTAVKGEDVLDSEVEACLIGRRSRDEEARRLDADYKRLGTVTESFRISWNEAASRVTALELELERAKEALRKIAGWPGPEGTNVTSLTVSEANELRRTIARAALRDLGEGQ